MAGPQALAGFRRRPVETVPAAGVGHLLGPGFDVGQHLLDGADQGRVFLGRECLFLGLNSLIVYRAPLGKPFRQPAVKKRDIAMAKDPEHPPGAGRGHGAAVGVIGDYMVAVADA